MQIFPHGDKLYGRLKNKEFAHQKELISELIGAYQILKKLCLDLKITNAYELNRIINYINDYLIFVDNDKFADIMNVSQNKIFSSILEEIMYYLFRNVNVVGEHLVCGSSTVNIGTHFKAYNEIIRHKSYEKCICYEKTDADFVMGISTQSEITKKEEIIPLVIIENKRYPDKTMRRTIEQIALTVKWFSPRCLYVAVVDLLDGFFDKDYKMTPGSVDQIYGVKERGKPERGKKIDPTLRHDVIFDLFTDVVKHLHELPTVEVSLDEKYKRGYMMERDVGNFDAFQHIIVKKEDQVMF